jgi:hypothetical protein
MHSTIEQPCDQCGTMIEFRHALRTGRRNCRTDCLHASRAWPPVAGEGVERMVPVKLDHCVIHVTEWERSNAFYTKVLGAELIERPVGYAGSATGSSTSMAPASPRPRWRACRSRRATAICASNGLARSPTPLRTSSAAAWRSTRARCSGSAPGDRAPASISAIPTARSWSSSPTHDPVEAVAGFQTCSVTCHRGFGAQR